MVSAPLYLSTDLYLDMLQEFLIPHLDEDDQERRIHFQQDDKKASCKSDARDAT